MPVLGTDPGPDGAGWFGVDDDGALTAGSALACVPVASGSVGPATSAGSVASGVSPAHEANNAAETKPMTHVRRIAGSLGVIAAEL